MKAFASRGLRGDPIATLSYVAVPDDFKILGNNYQSDIKHKISESL